MATPDISDIRGLFSITTQFADNRLQFALDAALGDIEDAIGIDVYNEVFEGDSSTVEDSVDDLDTTTTNEEAARTRRVTHAVYYKTIANVLENANTRIRPQGSVIKEHDAASPSTNTEIVNEYLTPSQVQEMIASYESKASSLLQPYLVNESVNMAVEYAICRG